VARIGAALDEHDAVFAKQAVFAGVIDKPRDKKFQLFALIEIT
jgi:hypothetical protein